MAIITRPENSFIYLQNLRFDCTIGEDAWGRLKPQPVVFTLKLQRAFDKAGLSDNVDDTMSYSTICKRVLSAVEYWQADTTKTNTIQTFHRRLHIAVRNLHKYEDKPYIQIETQLPKSLLRAQDGGYTFRTQSRRPTQNGERILSSEYDETGFWKTVTTSITDLQSICIIGVNPHERITKQPVNISLDMTHELDHILNFREIAEAVVNAVDQTSFKLLEALAYHVVLELRRFWIKQVTVKAQKPFAITAVDGAGVELHADYEGFTTNTSPDQFFSQTSTMSSPWENIQHSADQVNPMDSS